jgi:hypothetical protein
MERTLQLLFRRDNSHDREVDQTQLEGYRVLWPDGSPVALNMDAFCRLGQRLLGLGRALAGRQERLIELVCLPIPNQEQQITRLPGHRVRRLFLARRGQQGQLHFMDGTPTTLFFDLERDDPSILHLFRLAEVRDGHRLWLDLAARTVESE